MRSLVTRSRPIEVLVTGGGGFVGQWLARALIARGDHATLAGLGSRPESPRILTASEWSAVRWQSLDMRDEAAVFDAVRDIHPQLIVHLAGVSSIPEAERHPTAAYQVNVLGAVGLAMAAVRLRDSGGVDPLLVLVGSAAQYGNRAVDMPLRETDEMRPWGVYAATKVCQEIAVLQIARATGLRVICTRSFNHSGPGQDPAYVIPGLVARAKALRASAGGVLTLGNDTVRDYLHVTDVVQAYLDLASAGIPGEVYNVCSGVGVSTRELAAAVLDRAGIEAKIVHESQHGRQADAPYLVGSPAKLQAAVRWEPRKTHLDVIDDLLANG